VGTDPSPFTGGEVIKIHPMKKSNLITFTLIILSQHAIFAEGISVRDSLRAIVFNYSLIDTTRLMTGVDFVYNYIYEMPDSAIYYSRILYKESEKANYLLGMAAFKVTEGMYYQTTGNFKEAIKAYRVAIEHAKEADDPGVLANAYSGVSFGYHSLDMEDKAIENALQALKIEKEINDTEAQLVTLTNLALFYSRSGYTQRAADTYLSVIDLVDSLKLDIDTKAISLYRLGTLYKKTGKPVEAIRSYHEALKLLKQSDNMVFYNFTLYELAYFLLEDKLNLYGKEIGDNRKSFDIALAYLEELESWYRSIKDSVRLFQCYMLDAQAYMIKGEKQKAIDRAVETEEYLRSDDINLDRRMEIMKRP
jgi:tetratricopeptide (TPR) repeat protein